MADRRTKARDAALTGRGHQKCIADELLRRAAFAAPARLAPPITARSRLNAKKVFASKVAPTWLHAVLPGVCVPLVLLVTTRARAEGPCAIVARQTSETVIAYEPPATFTLCRGGQIEQSVVTGRPVYVELLPRPGEGMLRFRVHGRATQAEPSGLLAAAQRLAGLAKDLRTLTSSTETIAEASRAAPGPTSGPVDQARMLYLGIATPRFHETLTQVSDEADVLAVDAAVFSRWCGELAGESLPPQLAIELRARCTDPVLSASTIADEVGKLVAAVDAYRSLQQVAREALVTARARSDDGAAQARAITLLDDARHKAQAVLDRARQLAPIAASLSLSTWLAREAVRSTGTLQPGVPYYLTRYTNDGLARLQIDIAPVELAPSVPEATAKAGEATQSEQVFHFPVVSVHLVDVEAGIAAAEAPQVPVLGAGNVIEGKNLDRFVGLALVELEPLRWLWPDRPLAGLLRFPVIGIPFTRDPTQNFFGGIGLGWTGVGSISAGPYLLRELSLQNGVGVGSTVMPASGQTAGQAFAAVTGPELRTGYFVSASVDLVGLFHVFVPVHEPALDATTGAIAH